MKIIEKKMQKLLTLLFFNDIIYLYVIQMRILLCQINYKSSLNLKKEFRPRRKVFCRSLLSALLLELQHLTLYTHRRNSATLRSKNIMEKKKNITHDKYTITHSGNELALITVNGLDGDNEKYPHCIFEWDWYAGKDGSGETVAGRCFEHLEDGKRVFSKMVAAYELLKDVPELLSIRWQDVKEYNEDLK